MFITTIDTFQSIVRTVKHYELEAFTEPLQRAYENFLVPNFSEALCKDLKTKYLTNSLSAEEQLLVNYFQRIQAFAANYYHLPVNDVRQKPSGIVRVVSETEDTAFPRQFAALRQTYWENAHETLEKALRYVYENIADFPLFQSSPAYLFQQGLLLQNAQLFCHAIAIPVNRLLFNKLQFLIQEVEQLLVPLITGQSLYEELLSQQLSQTLSPNNQRLLKELHKAIAYEVFAQALQRLPIVVDEMGVYRIEQTYQTDYAQKSAATEHRMGISWAFYKELANFYKDVAIKFLENNATDYPLFPVTPPTVQDSFIPTPCDKSFIF